MKAKHRAAKVFVPIFRENFAICRTALGPFSNDGDGVEFSRASLAVTEVGNRKGTESGLVELSAVTTISFQARWVTYPSAEGMFVDHPEKCCLAEVSLHADL